MIGILFSYSSWDAGQLVLAAMRRSVSETQACTISRGGLRSAALNIVVAIDVPQEWGAELVEWAQMPGRKLIVFGRLPTALSEYLGCHQSEWPADLLSASSSGPAVSGKFSQSRAVVAYTPLAQALGGTLWRRPFQRFDFTDEWNNLGFGAILGDGTPWAVAQPIEVPTHAELASVEIDDDAHFAYAGLWDLGASSVLWVNRCVGLCDSFEWRLIENFISGYRVLDLSCQPVLREIPWGYDAAITSRLDCDEDVESARALWHAYQRMHVPFSLAVHTSNLNRQENHQILRELLGSGGAVLSHTATHAPNWGGSYDMALREGGESAALLHDVTGRSIRYAVSPFHQTPSYALHALSDIGYDGCIGGIIRNDPEFVLARGGNLAGMPNGFIGHSQQCMFHGDCMLTEGDPLAVYKQAFDLAFETGALFGYLDHPFSQRYQYGWSDERTRIGAHEQFIQYIRGRSSKPLFMNEDVALDFLRFKAAHRVIEETSVFHLIAPMNHETFLKLAVDFRGRCTEIVAGTHL